MNIVLYVCTLDEPRENVEALSKAKILFEGVPCKYNSIKASLLEEYFFAYHNVQRKAMTF